MRNIIKFGIVLFIICAISAGSLAQVYSLTKPRIEKQLKLERLRSLQSVLPGASSFENVERSGHAFTLGRDAQGKEIGVAFTVSPRGYSGLIEMIVGLDLKGRVLGVIILSQSETPGLGAKIKEPWFLEQFKGKTIEAPLSVRGSKKDINAIAAATISSQAVARGVKSGLELFQKEFPK